jgi:hypothetical protein
MNDLPGKTTADSLDSPSMDIANATRLPQQIRSVDPRPEQLPYNGEPPFPSFRTVHAYLHPSALDCVIEESIAGMELPGSEIDKKSE